MRERPADTWLLLLSSLPMQQWFARHRISCLLAGSPHAGVDLPAIDVDNRAVCRHAAGQLLARGHRRIALVLSCPLPAGDEAKRLGFEEAIGAHRGSAVTSLLVSHDGTLAGIRRALARTMRLTQRPTGFIVARSLNVLAVATELSRLGFKPGQDVALISRDSDHLLEFLSPIVARYAITPDAFARRLSRMLLAMIGGAAPAVRQVRLMPRAVAGESLCDAPPF